MRTRKTVRTAVGAALACAAVFCGGARALDLQAYDPARNDAIRNGLIMTFGPEAGKYASVTLPGEHEAVANVYDFRARPADTDAAVSRSGGRTDRAYLVDRGAAAAGGAGDTVYYGFTLVDTSRLDSAAVAAGTVPFNRMVLETVGAAGVAAVFLFEDRDGDGRPGAGERLLQTGAAFRMVPGESFRIGLGAVIGGRGTAAAADTVSLVCRTDTDRRDGRQLKTTFRNVVRFRGPPLFAGDGMPGPLAMLTVPDRKRVENGRTDADIYWK